MGKADNRLSAPAFSDSVVLRLEVNKAIDAAMIKSVVYIHAPAGFGKTIAMTLYAVKGVFQTLLKKCTAASFTAK